MFLLSLHYCVWQFICGQLAYCPTQIKYTWVMTTWLIFEYKTCKYTRWNIRMLTEILCHVLQWVDFQYYSLVDSARNTELNTILEISRSNFYHWLVFGAFAGAPNTILSQHFPQTFTDPFNLWQYRCLMMTHLVSNVNSNTPVNSLLTSYLKKSH